MIADPTASADPTADGVVWKLARFASAAWDSPDGRWMIYQRDAAWVVRDRSLPADPRWHGSDQECAFYTWPEAREFIRSHYRD